MLGLFNCGKKLLCWVSKIIDLVKNKGSLYGCGINCVSFDIWIIGNFL